MEHQDMRKSFDGLALATRQVLGEDPQSGALFVFVGKSKTRAKILWLEPNGYVLLYKRLHRALFVVPRVSDGATSLRIDAGELAALLSSVPRRIVRKSKGSTPTSRSGSRRGDV
jgi:transposase